MKILDGLRPGQTLMTSCRSAGAMARAALDGTARSPRGESERSRSGCRGRPDALLWIDAAPLPWPLIKLLVVGHSLRTLTRVDT